MKHMVQKTDLSVLDEIIKLAEGAMASGVSKKKPDLSIVQMSVGKKPGEYEDSEQDKIEDENGQKQMDEESQETESETEKPNFSEMDLQELIDEYKKMKG
jgi:hypothetical protein